MAYKSQHFVPKCYLKNFSTDGNRRSIALYNIDRNLHFENASIKGQCAKDYFYDENGLHEAIFGHAETRFGAIVTRLIKNELISSEDMSFLVDFSILQYLRTDSAAKRNLSAMNDMLDATFIDDLVSKEKYKFSFSDVTSEVLGNYLHMAPHKKGLSSAILKNMTNVPFITCDDPSVVYNRYYAQKLKSDRKGTGIKNTGFTIYLPLSSNFALLVYDKNIYSVPKDELGFHKISKRSDVDAFNALQVIKAQNNIFYQDRKMSEYVKNLYENYKNKRRLKWHKVTYAVRDDEDTNGNIRFKVTKLTEDMKIERESMIHLETYLLDPGVWPKSIMYRLKKKFTETSSEAGQERID